jgi:hypothetical protein
MRYIFKLKGGKTTKIHNAINAPFQKGHRKHAGLLQKDFFFRKMKKIIINVGAKTENNNIDGIFRPFVSVIDF